MKVNFQRCQQKRRRLDSDQESECDDVSDDALCTDDSDSDDSDDDSEEDVDHVPDAARDDDE